MKFVKVAKVTLKPLGPLLGYTDVLALLGNVRNKSDVGVVMVAVGVVLPDALCSLEIEGSPPQTVTKWRTSFDVKNC